MIKAVVERISSISSIPEVENIKSVRYQQQREGDSFNQALENRKSELQKQQRNFTTNENAQDDYMEYVIYDMKAYINWETRNRLDIKG